MTARFNSYSECLAYLARFTDYEKMTRVRYAQSTYNLDRMRRLLTAAGNPHLAVPVIHVTGTKGKGSTARIAHFLLRAHGFACGVYSSPHLVSMLERIHVNESDATEEEFLAAMNTLRPFLLEIYQEAEPTRPTFFEIMTATAFLIFKARKLDFSIVEVGVGGRLDATNVVLPVACVITLIDYDHMDKLGDTLTQIAIEKAGIIKRSVPIVTAERGEEAFSVIAQVAKTLEAPLFALGRDFHLGVGDGDVFEVRTWRGTYERLSLPVLGRHQRVNTAVAVALLDCLASRGFVTPRPEAVRQALEVITLPGRIELLRPQRAGPFVIVDGAHNPVSMRALAETLDELRGQPGVPPAADSGTAQSREQERAVAAEDGSDTARLRSQLGLVSNTRFTAPCHDKTILVIGMSEDKQIENTLRAILNCAGAVCFTAATNPRAAAPDRLREIAAAVGYSGKIVCVPNVHDAIRQACTLVGNGGLVVVTGSFYVAGEALSCLRN